jgi:hypothetical protein
MVRGGLWPVALVVGTDVGEVVAVVVVRDVKMGAGGLVAVWVGRVWP